MVWLGRLGRFGYGPSRRRRNLQWKIRRAVVAGAAAGGPDHLGGSVQVTDKAGGGSYWPGGWPGGWIRTNRRGGRLRVCGWPRAVGSLYFGNWSAHRDGFAFLGQDFDQGAVHRGGNFHRYLVGYHFDQRLVALNPVARLLEPLADSAFDNRFADVRKFYSLSQGNTACSLSLSTRGHE